MRLLALERSGFLAALALHGLLLPDHSHAAEKPPVAARKPVTVEQHGVTRTDDYAWLRSAKPDEVLKRPEALEKPIRDHLQAERRYALSLLAPNKALERRLQVEMRGRTSTADATVPEARGPWEYYTRYAVGAQRRLHCRRPRGGGAEQVMLDENKLAGNRREFSLDETAASPDHKLLAYSFDADGSERNTLKVRELSTGRDLADVIPEVRGSVAWSSDGQWLFYVRRDETKWARAVYRHRLGTPVAADALIYEETEEGFAVGLGPTLSQRFAVLDMSDFSTSQVALVDLAQPLQPPRLVTGRKAGIKYAATDVGDRLIVATNADGATAWKIGEKPLSAAADATLAEVVPHRPGRLIESFAVFAEHLAWIERDQERGSQQIMVRRLSDGAEHAITFGEEPFKVEFLPGLEQNTRTLRYTYETMAQPKQTFDYDLDTRERVLRKVRDVPSGHDPARYVTRRLQAKAQDGTAVPISVLYRKDTPLDGTAPVWLYGYGAYGDIQHPEFGGGRLSLVDRGFIYALAHVRGGGEKGDAWHDAGRLAHKMNTFTDFIAVAEHLVQSGMTGRGRIVASGASAGGTLVGAVANMAPDLFGAIYADVPFVDTLNTLLDRSLPLTEGSFSEFGNPIDSKADFDTIRSYSPYDNVRAQAYPAMLVLQSVNDTRVPYWEAAKWVAKVRALNTGGNPVLLLMKVRGGHGGGSGRFYGQADVAQAYAFGLQVLGPRARRR